MEKHVEKKQNEMTIRIREEMELFLKERQTIRTVAETFNVSKSSVHLDLSVRAIKYNLPRVDEVKKKLEYNASVRHIRGGEATKRKYSMKK